MRIYSKFVIYLNFNKFRTHFIQPKNTKKKQKKTVYKIKNKILFF